MVVVSCLAGCNDARFVQKDPAGGTVAFSANSIMRSYNRDAAIKMIKEQHNPNFTEEDIIREGEVVVGQKSTNDQRIDTRQVDSKTGKPIGEVTTNSSTATTSDLTEYRIEYKVVNRGPSIGGNMVGQRPVVDPQGNNTIVQTGARVPDTTQNLNQRPVNVDPRTGAPVSGNVNTRP